MKDDGSGRKISVHAIIGGIMSQITGAGFASGAVGAGLNEALIKNLKGKDPGTAQIVSAIIGAAAAKVAGGSAAAGASAAASGTKWNAFLLKYPNHNGVGALALHILKREDGKELSPEEAWSLVQGVNNVFSEAEPIRANAQNIQAENVQNYPKAISYLMNSGITKESAIQFFKEYNTIVRGQNWNGFSFITDDVHVGIGENQNPIEKIRMPKFELKKEYILEPYPPGVFTGENLVLPDTPLITHEGKKSPSTVTSPERENQGGKANDQSKVAFGKTIAIETFKAETDRSVTLYNKYANNPVKALKFGVFAPLGLGYDMYQDYGKYNGTDLAKVTLINGGGFIFSAVADSILIGSAGMSVEATILANIFIVEGTNEIKKSWAKTDEEKRRENP